jgi:23S rRNA pseudouridine2457 synthase
MADLYLFNKPFNVLSQFTDSDGRSTLANYIKTQSIYPAGRLDYDSEGLLILTSDGELQARIADPKHKLPKTYWVQVEGQIDTIALTKLEKGVLLKDGPTRPAKVKPIDEPALWQRNPPIRYRKDDITSWIELTITEGRNRQVRRMTAEVGFPTLRLIRYSIGSWCVKDLQLGSYIKLEVNLPKKNINKKTQKFNPKQNIKRKY